MVNVIQKDWYIYVTEWPSSSPGKSWAVPVPTRYKIPVPSQLAELPSGINVYRYLLVCFAE